MSIEDEEAEKPEGWLDDEPAEIADPGKTIVSFGFQASRLACLYHLMHYKFPGCI